jgi:hypothetical protein
MIWIYNNKKYEFQEITIKMENFIDKFNYYKYLY